MMGLQVSRTEGGQAVLAGFKSPDSLSNTHITQNAPFMAGILVNRTGIIFVFLYQRLLELRRQLGYEGVNFELGPPVELLLAYRALRQISSMPVSLYAVPAEVVPTGSRDGLVEHIQTDGAKKLLLRQHTASSSHIWEHIQKEKQVGPYGINWLQSPFFFSLHYTVRF